MVALKLLKRAPSAAAQHTVCVHVNCLSGQFGQLPLEVSSLLVHHLPQNPTILKTLMHTNKFSNIYCVGDYLTARMCMGCDRRRPVWGESPDEEEEEGSSGET